MTPPLTEEEACRACYEFDLAQCDQLLADAEDDIPTDVAAELRDATRFLLGEVRRLLGERDRLRELLRAVTAPNPRLTEEQRKELERMVAEATGGGT